MALPVVEIIFWNYNTPRFVWELEYSSLLVSTWQPILNFLKNNFLISASFLNEKLRIETMPWAITWMLIRWNLNIL